MNKGTILSLMRQTKQALEVSIKSLETQGATAIGQALPQLERKRLKTLEDARKTLSELNETYTQLIEMKDE